MEIDCTGNRNANDTARFMAMIEMPRELEWAVPILFSPGEVAAVLRGGRAPYTVDDFDAAWLKRAYRRGLIDRSIDAATGEPARLDGSMAPVFELGTFYSMLDIFVIDCYPDYQMLSSEQRGALDSWYFNEYCSRTFSGESRVPTDDSVVPLDRALELVEGDDRPIYLCACDCRSLRGDCGLPRMTCLTYRSWPNTTVDRLGISPISKQEACKVLRDADAAGLMHTVNAHGLCNCCGDCCYLFRAQRRAGTVRSWPASAWTATIERKACRGCGLCVRRCHMGAISCENGIAAIDPERCVGCGICATRCPAKAIRLVPSEENR